MAAKKYSIDFNDFTIGELELIEETTGVTFTQLSENMSIKTIHVILWVLEKRDNPDVTMEDLSSLKMSDIEFEAGDSPKA